MPTITRCPSCERALQVPDELLGQMVQCPSCGNTFTANAAGAAPAPPAPPPPRERERPPPPSEQAPPYFPMDTPAERPEPSSRRSRFDDEGWEEDDYRRRPTRRSEASSAVAGPAIALMITGGLGLGMGVLLAGVGVVTFLEPGGFQQRAARPEERAASVTALAVAAGFMITWGVVVLTGAYKMKNLQSYGFAMTAAIVALLPCNYCWMLGVGFGIWALVVLNKEDVKSAFR